MRVGIELTPLTYALTGIGYYLRHLVQELASLIPSGDLHGFIAGFRKLEHDNAAIPYCRLPVPPRLLNVMWAWGGWPRVDVRLGGVGFLREPGWSSPGTHRLFGRHIQRHALRADAVIACSRATKRDIISLLGVEEKRVHVIYDAADASFSPVNRNDAKRRVREALGIEAPYLLFVSTIEARKNVDGLLDAFARADVPQKLVIAGVRGWGADDVIARAETLKCSGRVVFTGYVPDRSLFPALYSAADAFVFPSWHEGFGLAVLEAMACGCPVISSNTSSLPEVGGDAPFYVDPRDITGLARTIEQVATDEWLRENMREKGLVRARHFSWQKCAQETLACYRGLL
ncbi:MAG: Mannosylfructose-phosphate synthase [Candidatus Hydrogenedentes bacterium ADurb.Bin179]|nr:MAG: Mannosylfructose-phosphate synthase [Candidatus Hydrogenedentes bacterium ADurb.Bin179]